MSRGYYASTRATSLSSGVTSGAVDLPVTDGTTFPDPDAPGNMEYTIIVGYGSDREEVCTVTAKPTADTLRVTRGEDGTSATAKNIGDVVVHGVSARDFIEPKTPAAHAASHAAGGTDPLAPLAPAAHAASHAAAGADPLTLAQSQITGLVTALAAVSGAAQPWNPTLQQGAPVGSTVDFGKYVVVGDLVVCTAHLTVQAGGTLGSPIFLSLPVVPHAGTAGRVFALGAAMHRDISTSGQHTLTPLLVGSSLGFASTASAASGYYGTVGGTIVGIDDTISVTVAYLKAS